MRAHVARVDGYAIERARFAHEPARKLQRVVRERKGAEIGRRCVAHAAHRDAQCKRIASCRMGRVRDGSAGDVAHVFAHVARHRDGEPAVTAHHAEVVGVIGGLAVSAGPVQVRVSQVAARQRRGLREDGHDVANVDVVHETQPEHPTTQPVEGEYLAPDPNPASGRNWRAAGGTAVGIGLVLAKFKGLLLALVNFKFLLFGGKFALSAVSFLASIWFYTLFFCLKFAIVFVLLIAVHELGHVIFVRGFGLSAPAIVFLPGLGAFTTWKGAPQSIAVESAIAFGGPLLGTLGGMVCFAYGYVTHEPFWYACANTAFFLNLFNMIPLSFFDGGRMTAAISPYFWIAGFAIVITLTVAFGWWSPILLLVIVLSLPRAWQAWRGQLDPRYYAVSGPTRLAISAAYFGLLAVLVAALVVTRVSIPGHSFA